MAARLRLRRLRAGQAGRLAWPAWGDHAWALVALVLALAALAGRGTSLSGWGWVRGHAWDEPWRWWSAAFVHLSDGHLAANVLGCAVVGAFGQLGAQAVGAATAAAGREAGGRGLPAGTPACDWALAWLAAWPLTHALLLAEPRLAGYAGLSGVLHAGVAVAALGLAVQGRGRARGVGAAVLGGLLVKLALEEPWRAPVQAPGSWDMAVAVAAHATGAGAGLACAAVALLARRRATMRVMRLCTARTDPP